MRKIIALLFILINTYGFAQVPAVTADPSLFPIVIRSLSNESINQLAIPLNGVVALKVPIKNLSLLNELPAGSCKIKISLGTKLVLAPNFNLLSVNTSNYFYWTSVVSGGIVEITGDLVAQLPANFSDTASFNIMGSVLNNSTIIANFLVTNHNTAAILSDDNAANNTSSLVYRVINAVILPVTFTNIEATKTDCSFKVDINIANEINVNKYEIEMSNELNNFENVATIDATNSNFYSYKFFIPEAFQKPTVLLRVKAVDFDGKVSYSEIKKISCICLNTSTSFIYPNPIPSFIDEVVIENPKTIFNGTYNVSLIDIASGKLISQKLITINNVNKFTYNLNTISAGQYLLKVYKKNQIDLQVFKLIKL